MRVKTYWRVEFHMNVTGPTTKGLYPYLPARRSSSRVISSQYLRWADACQCQCHTNLRFPSHRSFVILRIVDRKPGWTALKTFDVSCGSSRRLAGQESPASSFLFIMMSISVGCSLSVVCGVGRAIIFWSLTLRSFRGTTRIKRLGVGRMVRTVSPFTMNSWKERKRIGRTYTVDFRRLRRQRSNSPGSQNSEGW